MGPNTILGIMIASYIAPIAYVYYKYRANATNASGTRSISSIITSQEPLFLRENDTGGGAHNIRHYSKRGTSSPRVCLSWVFSRYYTKSSDVPYDT